MARFATTITVEPVAEICLYGTCRAGHGAIVALPDGRMLGDGAPIKGRAMSAAIWLAAADLRNRGISRGTARVVEPSGRHVDIDLSQRIPYAGDLQWSTEDVAHTVIP